MKGCFSEIYCKTPSILYFLNLFKGNSMKLSGFLVFRHVSFSLLFFCFSLSALSPQKNLITYEFSGGRFGDNLLSYLHAKWISYRYQIPLLYKPFPYSSQLKLHDVELQYCPENYPAYRKEVYMRDGFCMNFFQDKSLCLYICPYFPENSWEQIHSRGPSGEPWYHFLVDWQDVEFREIVKNLISLKRQYPLTVPPQDKINIAIHFREGGGYDSEDVIFDFMTKIPPLDFYIKGLSRVIKLFPGKSFYCHLFTDALNPQQTIQIFRESLPEEVDITFGCREKGNVHNKNVLEDFFSLFEFDVLVHPQSNFSLIPSLIHDYAITYSPFSARRDGINVVIDQVKLEINEGLYEQLLHKP